MEIIETKDKIKVINDSYNASYESVKAALEYINNVNAKRKIAVLGDVFELGNFSKEFHEKIGTEVAKNKINILITVGEQAKNISSKVNELNSNIDTYICENNQEAINKINELKLQGDIILVKASNGMKFNEIVEKIV